MNGHEMSALVGPREVRGTPPTEMLSCPEWSVTPPPPEEKIACSSAVPEVVSGKSGIALPADGQTATSAKPMIAEIARSVLKCAHMEGPFSPAVRACAAPAGRSPRGRPGSRDPGSRGSHASASPGSGRSTQSAGPEAPAPGTPGSASLARWCGGPVVRLTWRGTGSPYRGNGASSEGRGRRRPRTDQGSAELFGTRAPGILRTYTRPA